MRFFFYLLAQFITLLGSNLTTFAIPIWVYTETGSNVYLSLMIFAAFIPRVFLGPIAGAIVDIRSPKVIVLVSDFIQMVVVIIILTVIIFDYHTPSLLILAFCSLIGGLASTFQHPATFCIIPKMVSKEHLTKANGMITTIENTTNLIGPILAGSILSFSTIESIIMIDICTYILATPIFFLVFGQLDFQNQNRKLKTNNIYKKAIEGIEFIRSKKELTILLMISSITNFSFSISFIFLVPYLINTNASPQVIGILFSIGAGAQIIGGLLTTIIPSPKNLLKSELICTLFFAALGISLMGIFPNTFFILTGYVITMLMLPILNVWNRTNWHQMTPESAHGRVFATKRSMSSFLGMIGYAFSGPVLDKILVPMFTSTTTPYQVIFITAGAILIFSVLSSFCIIYFKKKQKKSIPST